jgi:hypothetical protein
VTDVRGRVWRGGKPQDDFVFSAISDYLVEDDTLVWITTVFETNLSPVSIPSAAS